jgi:hypothetical protein
MATAITRELIGNASTPQKKPLSMEPRTGSDFSQILHILQYSAERK